jgi:1-acyl-sn-glycerol-3-phosphate acyltransferase
MDKNVRDARLRVDCLWLSVFLRNCADGCALWFLLLQASPFGDFASRPFVLLWFVLPQIVLAPQFRALESFFSPRELLAGASGLATVSILSFAGERVPMVWVVLLGTVASVHRMTCNALVPSASRHSRLPACRLTGALAASALLGFTCGIMLSAYWGVSFGAGVNLADLLVMRPQAALAVPFPPAWGALLSVLSLLAALSLSFPAMGSRARGTRVGRTSFLADVAEIMKEPSARWLLMASGAFRGSMIAALFLLLAGPDFVPVINKSRLGLSLLNDTAWVLVGAVVGSVVVTLQKHPRRILGLVPVTLTALAAMVAWAGHYQGSGRWPLFVIGALAGSVNVALTGASSEVLGERLAASGRALADAISCSIFAAALFFVIFRAGHELEVTEASWWWAAGAAGLAAALAWWRLTRESLEVFMEVALWPLYRIHGHGPGTFTCPRRGPILVIANHSSYFDPLWLAKVLPRRVTPMMTSAFYDLPVLHWLMTVIVKAIRVEVSTFRREAPELKEGIAALDRGECVILFPEGMLRRKEQQPVRQFGQGVWHILKERPTTPVITCWIEGGWGSYFSYSGGPPMTNKRIDWWRRIDVAVQEPEVLDPNILDDQRGTRSFLQSRCIDARKYLGLAPLASAEDEERAGEDAQDQAG